MLDDVETALPERNRCTGQPKGSKCWMALTDRPGCYVWDPNFQPDATVIWTAECAAGLAQGTGTLNWVWDAGLETLESTGRLQAGQRHGQWVFRYANGTVTEGSYVEGKREGQWVWRYTSGEVQEGSYLEGKEHGQWVKYKSGRVVAEAYFVDGKGKWVRK